MDSLEVLCEGCRALCTSWLLETLAKVLTVQSDCKGTSSAEEMTSLVLVDWGLRRAQKDGLGGMRLREVTMRLVLWSSI